MLLYLDDITLSDPAVTKRVLEDVWQHGLKTKNSKIKTFSASAAKTVTGVVVVDDEVRWPNGRHKKIWETRRAIRVAAPSDLQSCLNLFLAVCRKPCKCGLRVATVHEK